MLPTIGPSDRPDPALAIMLPCFGDGPLLRETVASVLASDVDSWTLTLLDDGPEDPALSRWAGSLDPRVSYRRNEPRLGINRNFQQCIDLAAAPLVTVLGADDLLEPSYVRSVLGAAAAAPVDVALFHPEVTVVDGTGAPALSPADRVKRWMYPDVPAVLGGEELAASLLRGNWMYFPSVAFRTDVVRRYGFQEGLDLVLDLDLYLRMLVDGHRFSFLEGSTFCYRRHADSLSSSERFSGVRFREESSFFTSTADALQAHGWRKAARAARLHITSRLHAIMLIPAAVGSEHRNVLPLLVRHGFGR